MPRSSRVACWPTKCSACWAASSRPSRASSKPSSPSWRFRLPRSPQKNNGRWWQKRRTASATTRKNLRRMETGEPIPTELTYPIQTWRFGDDLAMLFLGGEVVVDYSHLLRAKFDAARLWLTAYANDVGCYIPSEQHLARRGRYEGGDAMVWYDKPARWPPASSKKLSTRSGGSSAANSSRSTTRRNRRHAADVARRVHGRDVHARRPGRRARGRRAADRGSGGDRLRPRRQAVGSRDADYPRASTANTNRVDASNSSRIPMATAVTTGPPRCSRTCRFRRASWPGARAYWSCARPT